MREKRRKTARLTMTTLAPVGVENRKEAIRPTTKQETESTAEQSTTPLKLWNRRIELSAGKMIRLEMSRVPIMRMPTTMVTAVSAAMRRL